MTSDRADEAIVTDLGARLRQARLRRNLSQAQLARDAGVGEATLQRLEDGRSANLTTLVRVLRALDLDDGLERLVPPLGPSPLEQLDRRGKPRRRAARAARPAEPQAAPWRWGDEVEPKR